MKAILATTMLALLALAGFLIFQFLPQGNAPEAQPQAMAPAAQPAQVEAPAAQAFVSEPVVEPESAVQTAMVEPEQAAATPKVPANMATEVTESGQIDESQLPQPNDYNAASITASGREIDTMNRVEVLGALNNGADQILDLREQIKQAEELGNADEVARLKVQHESLETELVNLANHGVSLNNN